MADFKNLSDFRKSKNTRYGYQDPTYLSFVILFDFNDRNNSPLLSGAAEDFLVKLAGGESNAANSTGDGVQPDINRSSVESYYLEKLIALRKFKRALATINNDMPWYWQSLSGLDVLQQWDPTNAYLGKDDAKITISTLESLNLPIAGLMHLYRKAVFDERKWNYVIPANLRRFRMYIYVTEVRKIKNMSRPKVNGVRLQDFNPSIDIENSNEGIMGQRSRPYFMFALKYCEFDIKSGTNAFADLQKSPTESAVNEISISYESLYDIEARVLNGIIEDLDPSNLSPAPESENESLENLGDYVNDRFQKRLKELQDRGINDLKRLSQEKKNELTQAALDASINRVPTIENIYQNTVQGLDDSTNVLQQTRNISLNLRDNVFGKSGKTQADKIQDALDDAAVKSLGNVYE